MMSSAKGSLTKSPKKAGGAEASFTRDTKLDLQLGGEKWEQQACLGVEGRPWVLGI